MSNPPRRLGRFRIALNIIDSDQVAARAILKDCIVVRAEASYEHRAIEYVAFHPDFAEVSPDSMTPFYDVVITEAPNATRTVEWRR